MGQGQITENLQSVRDRVRAAAEAAGRTGDEVKIVAVTKNAAPEEIMVAYNAGQRRFGENRVQDLTTKAAALPSDIEWHFIGHLQSNKVRDAILSSALIHSVDSVKLLDRINAIAEELHTVQYILLQANISGEATKFGATRREIVALAERAVDLKNVFCAGFMTMAPYGATDEELEHIFSSLWSIRDFMRERHARIMPELSMGMSDDFQTAIACGATYVRIGTAIFGNGAT